MREPVGRRDERHLREGRVVELGADPNERPFRVERGAHHVEQGGPSLERLEQRPKGADVLRAELVHEAGRTAYVHAGLAPFDELRERRLQLSEELPLAGESPSPRSGCGAPRPEREASHLLVEVLGSPVREPCVDRRVEDEEPFVTPPVDVMMTTTTTCG